MTKSLVDSSLVLVSEIPKSVDITYVVTEDWGVVFETFSVIYVYYLCFCS